MEQIDSLKKQLDAVTSNIKRAEVKLDGWFTVSELETIIIRMRDVEEKGAQLNDSSPVNVVPSLHRIDSAINNILGT